MNLNEYQRAALRTSQTPAAQGAEEVVPLLGLAGEVGELLAEYKKHLRDGKAHELFTSRVGEELGDILWYIAAVASRFGLGLDDVAQTNLLKVQSNWMHEATPTSVAGRFDDAYPDGERFPLTCAIQFTEVIEGDVARVEGYWDNRKLGDTLTDNSYEDDGYRFHDVFHLACVACLGWSPVTRRNLRLKRKSDPSIDEIEDGGRATVIEEGVTALVFSYAVEHNWLRGVQRIDHDVLKMVKKMTAHLEVGVCTIAEWEATVLAAYPVWLEVWKHRGGIVELDLATRSIRYGGPIVAEVETGNAKE